MKLLAQCRAISAVQSTGHLTSQVVFNIGAEEALSGISSVWKISSELLMDAVEVVTLAYLIAGDCIALGIVSDMLVGVRSYVESIAEKITEENRKNFKGECVYVLRDPENDLKVSYVGRSKEPWKRYGRHKKDKRKRTKETKWRMYIVKSGLSTEEAKALENALICVYTIDALANARHEIAVKNFDGFKEEIERAESICKMPLRTLENVMKGDYK